MSAETDLFTRFMNDIFAPIYGLGLGLSFAYFLFGAMMYMWQMNNEEARSKSRQHLLWGGIGLFIMFSIGGLMKLLSGVFGGIFGS
jgi:hypothetical protein